MNEWDILEIEETSDLSTIKKAYAALIKKYKPHEYPEKFQEIHTAYEKIKKIIEYGIALDNDHNEDSIYEPIDPDNRKLINSVLVPSFHSSEQTQRHEIEKLYVKHITALYTDIETRNNIDVWRATIHKNSAELLMDDSSFYLILEHIIKAEFLYRSDFSVKPEIYILLFDFFNIDEKSYVSNHYSEHISKPLLQELSLHRHNIRLASIQASDFNYNNPSLQIEAEDYYTNEILHTADRKKLLESLDNAKIVYTTVLCNVVFKDILDKHISSTIQNDDRLIGHLYKFFRFKNNKKVFFKILIQMGYSKEDIKNCLNFCKTMYVRYAQPPLWYRIVMNIPPLAIIFGLLCWVYILIKKVYCLFLPKQVT